jgi:hypothetical protein
MSSLIKAGLGGLVLLATGFMVLTGLAPGGKIVSTCGAAEAPEESYRVLAPIESGNLLLFPVVPTGKSAGASSFLTLDEGIKSGQVEVTEAGKVQGLVRPRNPSSTAYNGPFRPAPPPTSYRGDQVNTLVLVNNSDKPLLLLAGEIVTGGKQDRVIAKDRIVPSGGDPIDLGVFCIEPGRWTEASATFSSSAKSQTGGFMVQPSVREKAMAKKDQQEVWASVGDAVQQASVATAPPPVAGGPREILSTTLNTTSYARAMQNGAVSAKVDEAAAPVMKAREQVFEQLRKQGAVGVVVAVRGEIVWADIFANSDLFGRYWTKLVRSYAAESLIAGGAHPIPSVSDAQRFLDAPAGGTETSEGDVGIYRYRELHSGNTETFVLESLLSGSNYDVHISKMKLRGETRRVATPFER